MQKEKQKIKINLNLYLTYYISTVENVMEKKNKTRSRSIPRLHTDINNNAIYE